MRSRNIKPDLFRDYQLCQLDIFARVLFSGLWCLADREGRLEDCPPRIRADVFPYDDVDVEKLLESLATSEFITRYKVEGDPRKYIQIKNFHKHQNPHKNEKPSEIPVVERSPEITRTNPVITRANPADSLNLIPDSNKTLLDDLKILHSQYFGATILTGPQLEILKRWAQEKKYDDIQHAYEKSAGSRPATRWGWIVDEVERPEANGGKRKAFGDAPRKSKLDIETGDNVDWAGGF